MLSLYIHIPFCVKKCLYCGFYSTQYDQALADDYLSAMRLEAFCYKDSFKDRLFESIYIGGGTPTTLSRKQLKRVLDIISDNFHAAGDAEITVEANPNTITGENLQYLIERGTNRLSIGVQSFKDHILKTLGRLHTAGQAMAAVSIARRSGVKNLSIDLIYGIPGQRIKDWEDTLLQAIALKPEHISAYGLSLDEGSFFMQEAGAGRIALPGEDLVARMYERAIAVLADSGYGHYEISNFALPGFECRHNMNYWERGEYLGLGPGAWSFISNRRYHAIADAREYVRRLGAGGSVLEEEETVGCDQAATESLMLRLRTSAGIDLVRYEREYGTSAYERIAKNLHELRDAGLFQVRGNRLQLTNRGKLLSNEAIARLTA